MLRPTRADSIIDQLTTSSVALSHCCFRSRLAPHHVDKPHHCCQFQEASRVHWKSELREQQVWVVPAAQRRERVCNCQIPITCHPVILTVSTFWTHIPISLLCFKQDDIWKLTILYIKLDIFPVYRMDVHENGKATRWCLNGLTATPPCQGWDCGPQCFSDLVVPYTPKNEDMK